MNQKKPLSGLFWQLAEREGFEPSKGYKPLPDFESGTFDHSATSPEVGRESYGQCRRLTSGQSCMLLDTGDPKGFGNRAGYVRLIPEPHPARCALRASLRLSNFIPNEIVEPSKGYKPLPDFESGTFDHSATSPEVGRESCGQPGKLTSSFGYLCLALVVASTFLARVLKRSPFSCTTVIVM